jgi:periplasmic protein TonB
MRPLPRQPLYVAAGVLLLHAAVLAGLWSSMLRLPAQAEPVAAVTALWLVVPARLVPPPVTTPAEQQPPLAQRRAARAGCAAPPAPAAPPPVVAAAPAVVAAVAAVAEAAVEPPTSAPLLTAAAARPTPAAPAPLATVHRTPPDNAPCGRAPYPALLKERGIEGTLRLRVHVSAEGLATQVQLLRGSGFRLFDEAAMAQARGCRFRPARLGEQPVDEWVEYPVRFALEG